MAPLPTWFQERAFDSGSFSTGFTSSDVLLKARDEAFDLLKGALYERADGASNPGSNQSPNQSPKQSPNSAPSPSPAPAPNPSFVGGQGSRPASDFNNKAYLGLFATLGVALILASLWFFFWAKNGGFHFREGDWDDYKSTVLRRKGPDGKTLTNATKSTKLGGSTIVGTQHYKWAKQTAKSVISYDEKGRKGILGKRGWGKTHSVTYSDDFTDYGDSRTRADEMTEVRSIPEPRHHSTSRHHYERGRDNDVHEYKKEKPARVGGLNRIADGSHVDTTNSELSDVHSENSDRPILKKTRKEDKERAERRARTEAAKMERRWKREAEEAAAALARESANAIPTPKKTATPPSKPSASKQRSASHSASPKKRDFSYQTGPESETLSTAQTGTTSRRTTSYYEQYRPQASDSPGYSSDYASRSRQSSPVKKSTPGRGGRGGGYRRGADSDLD